MKGSETSANLIGPSLLTTDNTELASSTNTTRFTKRQR